MKKWLRPVAIGLAGVIAVFALMGEGSEDDASGSDKPEASAKSDSPKSESSGIGESQASPAPLGTTIEVAKGWDVTVNSAKLNADAELKAGNQFNEPDSGTQFMLVNVTITNGSDEPSAAFTDLKLSALPSSGVAIDSYSCLAAGVATLDTLAQMQPGASLTGDLCFQVKTDEVASTVLLGEPQFTMDTNEDQRFFAIQ